MTSIVTIHVLAFGKGFELIFKVIATLVKGSLFLQLLKLTALFGIILTTIGYVKSRDPMVFMKWLAVYSLVSWIILIPKTSIAISDIADGKQFKVDNVPTVVAYTASLFTSGGYELTRVYESLLSSPDSLTYSKTGMLFGAKLLQASHDFHIADPELKEGMNAYFRNCVVGDIAITRKYSVGDLKRSKELQKLVFDKSSPIRRVKISAKNGEIVKNLTCQEAITDKDVGLKARLNTEVENASTVFGMRLFGVQKNAKDYSALFTKNLGDVYKYYQDVTDESANLALQTMMVNAMQSGLANYSARSNSSAAILNNQFSKSQLQHRSAWNVGFQKAIWFLPLLHTVLLMMLFGIFPIVLILATVVGGSKILKSYLIFLGSLQLWPMLFSIINAAVVMYGHSRTSSFGAISAMNLDPLDQIHEDLAGVAGFLMMSVPFLAKGVTSNIGEAFAGLATSLTSHMQSSSMAVASEVASASYAFGNNSFYNSTANTLSANKHDVNYSALSGQRTIQADSGTLVTETADNHTVYNSAQAISQGVISVASSKGLQDTLTQMKEQSENSVQSSSVGFNNSLSSAGHHAQQFNTSLGSDVRLVEGLSHSESAQAQKALAHAWSIAEDYGKRHGISTENAFSHLSRHAYGFDEQAGFDSSKAIWGKGTEKLLGVSGRATVSNSNGWENSDTSSNRNHKSLDLGLSKRDEESFRNDLSTIESYTKNHHLDTSGSESENILYQVGADLREAKSYSDSLSASIAQSERISDAQNYVSTHAENLNHNLNQEAITWAEDKYGKDMVKSLETNTSSASIQSRNEQIKQEFLNEKAQSLIHNSGLNVNPQSHYSKNASELSNTKNTIISDYGNKSDGIQSQAAARHVGVNGIEKQHLSHDVKQHFSSSAQQVNTQGGARATSVRKAVKSPLKKHTGSPQ